MTVGCGDEQISWPTAEPAAPGLPWINAVGYSVIVWIDGKEKVYGSRRRTMLLCRANTDSLLFFQQLGVREVPVG